MALAMLVLAPLLPGCAWKNREGVSRALRSSRQLAARSASALERAEFGTAESLAAQAVEICPVDPEARRQYGEALWRRGDHAGALRELDEAIKLSSDDPELLTRRAELHLARGNLPAALQGAQRALDLEPEFAQAWILRARIHRKSGQPRQALADYHRALGLDPAEREVLMELAELHLELAPTQGGGGRPDLHRSLAALQALADTYPQGEEPTHVLLLTGVVLLQLARPHAAAEVLARASQRQPPDPDIYCRLAEAQLAAGQPNAAWESIQRAMAIAPGHAPSAALFQQIQWRLAQGASATARR